MAIKLINLPSQFSFICPSYELRTVLSQSMPLTFDDHVDSPKTEYNILAGLIFKVMLGNDGLYRSGLGESTMPD